MRVRIQSLRLVGTDRKVELQPGLNIITGPITTGKTTLLRLCRFLLGSRSAAFPPEVSAATSAIGGQVLLGENSYSIIRPLTSTATASVEIAGPRDLALRLPAHQPDALSQQTYGDWLLDELGLPKLRVPSAPTRPESDSTPVTINDFLLYCELTQSGIDDSVFGSRDPFKNIKRKYVFEIVYGAYGIESASLHERLRDIDAQMRALRADKAVLDRLLANTAWSNRAELEQRLTSAQAELDESSSALIATADRVKRDPEPQAIRNDLARLDQRQAELKAALERERIAKQRVESLAEQLRLQSARLTRSIVADALLLDFEFIVCPRCGSPIDKVRESNETCRLCLQRPSVQVTRTDLVKEQERIRAQLVETMELIKVHDESAADLERQIDAGTEERASVSRELELKTRAFLSDSVSEIVASSEGRVRAQELISRLRDYLRLFERLDESVVELQRLETIRNDVQAQLEDWRAKDTGFRQRIVRLNQEFNDILGHLQVPRFPGVDAESRIDPQSYLPILYGRRFDDLSSQGLKVIVNVAHALAHQRTAIELDCPLPNILFIDGLTSNIGHRQDLDRNRVEAIYRYLISLSSEMGDRLQIIVADNDIPDDAKQYIALELSETDRLAPV